MTPEQFITKWKVAQGREETNSGPFLTDLCQLLNLPTPGPWTGDFAQSPFSEKATLNDTSLTDYSFLISRKDISKPLKTYRHDMVSILKKLHDDLDTAVAEAYNWPKNLPDQEILQRLVNLNTQRHQEEQSGQIRWLRPEYQCKATSEKK